MSLNFIIYSSGGPYVWLTISICANFVKGIMGNISVKLF